MKFQLNSRVLLLMYVVGLTLAVAAVVLLYQIDLIVHGLLYEYGLQFNYEWAVPYWTLERLALGLLGAVAGINAFLIIHKVLVRPHPRRPKAAQLRPKPTSLRPKPVLKTQRKEVEKEKVREERDDGVEVVAIPMVCNKCGKVFTQPLCMFDFSSGKPRLVNVCPYCNAILAMAGNSKTK